MTKRMIRLRKFVFSLLLLTQVFLFFYLAVIMGAPLIQTRMERYPHAFLGDKMLSGVLSIVNHYVYGIFFSLVIIIVLIFELLKYKKISPLLTFVMIIISTVNCINAMMGYLHTPFLPCLITAITTDVLFVACTAIWTVKLVKHYKAKKSIKDNEPLTLKSN